MNRVDIKPGDTFGRLTVVREIEGKRESERVVRRQFLCRCSCGNPLPVHKTITALRNRGQTSCGCEHYSNITKHGLARRGLRRDPLYNCWQGIYARCTNPNATGYENYGGRRVLLYYPWHDPEVFVRDVLAEIGPRTGPHMSVDRIDPDLHYWPGNIRWLPKVDQPHNRRLRKAREPHHLELAVGPVSTEVFDRAVKLMS